MLRLIHYIRHDTGSCLKEQRTWEGARGCGVKKLSNYRPDDKLNKKQQNLKAKLTKNGYGSTKTKLRI